jgi:WD40 repeat protein
MILGQRRLVKCSLIDGSILKDYTSMFSDANRPAGIPPGMSQEIWPKITGANNIRDMAATSDHKWLFAACGGGWWAMFDVEQDKCVSRQYCTLSQGGLIPKPTSVAVSPDDQIIYMVTSRGTVESYDFQAAIVGQMKHIPNQHFVQIIVDPNNQFVFITSRSGNLYKYDSG